MSTPVLFLDDASRYIGEIDREQAKQIAMTLLATLKRIRTVNKKFALNTARPISQYQIADNWTLHLILGGPAFREEWDFIRTLNDRSPLAVGLDEGLLQKVGGTELYTLPSRVPSSALALANLLDSATISFDAHADWSKAWVEVIFLEIEDDGSISETEAKVRNASQVAHVEDHIEWLKILGFSPAPTALQVWNQRADIFPNIRFLPRVQKDLADLEASGVAFIQARLALEALTKDISTWKQGNSKPNFSRKTTPEHEQRQKLCWARDDVTGRNELFDWHSRFTGGLEGRIHFRLDSVNQSIIIAYVGGKLMREISSY